MRFVFLTLGYHPDLPGGAYRYATEVAERLAARGHGVKVLSPNPNNALAPRESRSGVELSRFPNSQGFFAWNWSRENWAASALLRVSLSASPEPALVVLHHAFFAPCLAACRRRTAAFVFYGPWGQEFGFARQVQPRSGPRRLLDRLIAHVMRGVERRALTQVRQVLVLSEYSARQLADCYGQIPAPVTVISAGVNTSQFQPAPERLTVRHQLGVRPDQYVFLAVRRLDPRMGLLTLIEAFSSVAKMFPQARLWLAGRGSQQAQLQARVDTLGLARQATLIGFVREAELPRVYAAADCTIMPSLDLEGFGLATVESLACGTPVLGSRAGATPELLAPLGESLLFAPGSTADLAAKLRAILAGELALPSREVCAAYARRNYTWDRPVAAFERAWVELNGQSPSA